MIMLDRPRIPSPRQAKRKKAAAPFSHTEGGAILSAAIGRSGR
jgi:hypothetical protein